MSTTSENSLLEQFALLSPPEKGRQSRVIPVHDHSLFLDLASEAARQLKQAELRDLVVVIDSATATQLDDVRALAACASQVVFAGPVPEHFSDLPQISSHGPARPGEQIFVACSAECEVAVLGQSRPITGQDSAGYTGCWTFDRVSVFKVLQLFFPALDALPFSPEGSARAPLSVRVPLLNALMRCQAGALGTLQRDMAMDKNDLFSVLNILKAISAKRRAHDVLFVFVEQIARVVSAERCSIVRVWGSDRSGQVLASHEDSTVNHREILLDKYPELRAALTSHQKVAISDVRTHPLTQEFAEVLETAHIRSLLVIPIVLFDETIGSLFLRAARSSGTFTVREISFFEVVAEAAANALERAHLFESIQIANERLERLAVTDGLTGLYNHRYCRDRLEEEFDRATRYKLPLSFLIFDVDNFKKFNDNYGHLLGDTILREIAERTLLCIRKSDLVARYGGEEFIVIMPQTEAEGAAAEAERLRSAIGSRPFDDVPDRVPVTVSVGVATLDAASMRSYDDIIRAADMALYEAKRSGKNRVAVYSELQPVAASAIAAS